MDRPVKEIFERLGPAGLSRALADVLDPADLVRLANACGLKYRGMRTQSQPRERLLADLVDRAGKQEASRRTIVRALQKQTGDALREWEALGGAEQAGRLSDEGFLRGNGKLGLHLFLLAAGADGAELDRFGTHFARQSLLRLAANGAAPAPSEPDRPSREADRLQRRMNDLEKKTRHLEAQLAKMRELHKTAKRDLIQRKGELAESRMLAERLRREAAAAQTAAQVATAGREAPPPAEQTLADLSRAVRKLESGQRKIVHELERLSATGSPPAVTADPAVAALGESAARLEKELGQQRQELRKDLALQAKQVEELRKEIAALAAEPAAGTARRTTRRTRAKGPSARVGVFIDVQNVYYGARQLKGKLDFDALMQAAVQDRRLIQATAYVVESKEIDRSQFIAMLEDRGIRVQRKSLKIRADGSMKGDWDIEMALDALDAAPGLDVVVLVSGDGDFTSLVERVRAIGPRVEVIAFPRNTAKALAQAADHFQPLDRKFMIYPRKSASPRPPSEEAAVAEAVETGSGETAGSS
jgi:uncharacterized LabA/DUF88 family protein